MGHIDPCKASRGFWENMTTYKSRMNLTVFLVGSTQVK